MAATPLPADISVENHESVLGRWRVARWTPPQLAGLVDHMWYFQGEMVRRRERIFPDGRLELIVHFGPVYREAAGAGGVAFPASGMVGQLLRSTVIEAPAAPCEVLGVRLHVAGAYALLRRPMNEMAGLTVDLRDVMGSAAAELVDSCGAETTARGRLGRAAEWLAARMLPDAVDPAVAWATAEIERRHGAVSIGALQQRTGWSRTRFHATFRRQIGVPPKVFARVVRFRRALMMVGADAAPLARIAQDAGYYDQATSMPSSGNWPASPRASSAPRRATLTASTSPTTVERRRGHPSNTGPSGVANVFRRHDRHRNRRHR